MTSTHQEHMHVMNMKEAFIHYMQFQQRKTVRSNKKHNNIRLHRITEAYSGKSYIVLPSKILTAKPKSASLICPEVPSRIFSGFMSR